MNSQQSHVHHYVPRWYQRRFLQAGQFKYHYLDLHPGIVYSAGVRHERGALLNWGPGNCFYEDELYTLKLGTWSTDEVEKRFFGAIDSRGRGAVELEITEGSAKVSRRLSTPWFSTWAPSDSERLGA